MKTSEFLREAKKKLWDGTNKHGPPQNKAEGLCYAFKLAADKYNNRSYSLRELVHDHAYHLKSLIRSRLGHCVYYTHWLMDVKGININTPEGYTDHVRVQLSRHAWIDSLIAEFEAKGD